MADNPASITRRDFLNGIPIAVGGAVAAGLSPECIAAAFAAEPAPQDAPGYYPPALTGLRGSHPGAFEAAHRLRDGDFWSQAGDLKQTDEDYDLVVVGGGISGLAAAHFYRAKHQDARILILDNHDDFGGHAKRNEFSLDGRLELHQRRHAIDRQPATVQRRSRRPVENAGHRSRGADAKVLARRFLSLARAQPQHISRPGNLWRRQADRRAARRFLGATARRRAVVAEGAKRHRAHPGSRDRLHAGPHVGGEEDAPRRDELSRLPAERGQGRSRRHPVLPEADPRRVGRRHRRGLRARRVGVRIPGLQRPEARARLGAAHGLHGERLCRQRRLLHVPFSRRQCHDRAAAGARSDSRQRAGQQRRGCRHGADRLRAARSAAVAGAHPAQQHGGARAQCRRSGVVERRRDRLFSRRRRVHGARRRRACSPAGT